MSYSAFNLETIGREGLQERYKELLNAPIKIEPDPFPSFLEISGFPHYEEVISNWYKFFFESTGAHGFQTLFIDTLVEMINERSTSAALPRFEKCCVIRERSVKEKRIDLLLYDEATGNGLDETYRNAIIVENKIFADLYNELTTYHENIQSEEGKAGVVLSITPHTQLPETFVNILHKDFLNRITRNMGGYLLRASDKYLLLLKDLIQQISLFSKTENMKEYINFYFDHAEKINELLQIRTRAQDALLDDLNTALFPTQFRWGRRYPDSLNIRCEHHDNVLLILKTDKIFDQASYQIEFWVTNGLAKALGGSGIKERLKNETTPPDGFALKITGTGSKYAWVGTQVQSFDRTPQNIHQLPTRIADDLRDHWSPFILQTLSILKNEEEVSII